MRAIYSYGIALVIVLLLAVWMATGTLVNGGHGPGNGEKPVVSLIEKNGGPLTNTVEKSGVNSKVALTGTGNGSKAHEMSFQGAYTGQPAPLSWTWTFGDGSTDTGQNPTRRYAAAGTYNVVLTITNGTCTRSTASTPVTVP